MNAVLPASRPSRRAWPWLLLAAVLAVLAWRGQRWVVQRQDSMQREDARIAALEQRVSALRRDLHAQSQRIRQADAVNRVLRDEMLGVGQRAALLEDSVHKLADPARHGAQALRLDEVELLLGQGMQRLQLAGDLDGARRAYALAAGVLDGVDDPAWLSLRQTLAQERAALEALGGDPKALAAGRLDAFAAQLAPPPASAERTAEGRTAWWRRAFDRLLVVRPSDSAVAVTHEDRTAADAALRLELALARSAAERRDMAAWRAALARADAWLPKLWPPSPALRAQRARLQALRALPLRLDLPTFGSTLQQLRAMRTAP